MRSLKKKENLRCFPAMPGYAPTVSALPDAVYALLLRTPRKFPLPADRKASRVLYLSSEMEVSVSLNGKTLVVLE